LDYKMTPRFTLVLGYDQDLLLSWVENNTTLYPSVIQFPEHGLHPRKQVEFVDLKIQESIIKWVFITHSLTIVNRLILRVAEGKLNHKDLVFVFVSEDEDMVIRIEVDKLGRPSTPFPPDFFGQDLEDAREIIKARRMAEARLDNQNGESDNW
jgi:Uncharacterized conserved protein